MTTAAGTGAPGTPERPAADAGLRSDDPTRCVVAPKSVQVQRDAGITAVIAGTGQARNLPESDDH